MKTILLLSLSILSLSAMETNPIPDFRDRDKQLHFAVGAAAITLAQPVNRMIIEKLLPDATTRQTFWARIALDSLEATALGVAKEVYDSRHTDRHTVDLADASGTALGGISASFVWNIAIP